MEFRLEFRLVIVSYYLQKLLGFHWIFDNTNESIISHSDVWLLGSTFSGMIICNYWYKNFLSLLILSMAMLMDQRILSLSDSGIINFLSIAYFYNPSFINASPA